MKTKRMFVIVLLAALMLLTASVACNAANNLPFISTPTPTNTSTPTSTPTPTITPTPLSTFTPTPLPDFSAVVLKLEDLPAGFEEVSSQSSVTDTQALYSFVNSSEFQVLSGATLLLASQSDQTDFDTMLNNPDLMMESVAAGASGSEFRNMKEIPGMDGFGEASKAFTAETIIQGTMMQADFFIMKKGVVGSFLISLQKIGETPPITIQDLAKILNERLDAASN